MLQDVTELIINFRFHFGINRLKSHSKFNLISSKLIFFTICSALYR